MKKFLNMDAVTLEKVGNDLYILVENFVYKKVKVSNENTICFFSEQEQHLIKLYENKVFHFYCILTKDEKGNFHYVHLEGTYETN